MEPPPHDPPPRQALTSRASISRYSHADPKSPSVLAKVSSNEIGTAEGYASSLGMRTGPQVVDIVESSSEDSEKGPQEDLKELWVSDDEWYPDAGWRAWKVVLGCFIFVGCQIGYGMVWGVVVVAMKQTPLFESQPLSILNLVIGLCNVATLGLSYFTGRLGERFGYKPMILISAICSYLSFILSATAVNSLVTSFFFQGLFVGVSTAIGMPLYMSLPSQWFKRRRGLATGVTISGAGFGGAVGNLVFRAILPRTGYRNAILIWGSINFFMCLVGWSLLEVRVRPVPPGGEPVKKRWLPKGMTKDAAFYLLLCSLAVGNFGFLSPFYFLTSYTKLHCPYLDPNSLLPAIPLVVATCCSGIGRIGSGFLADRIGPVNAMVLTWLLGGVAQVVVWPFAKSFGGIIAFAALYGLCGTGFLSLLPVCCAQLFGVEGLATITGAAVVATAPGQFLGSTIGGLILTSAGGSYAPVGYYSGAMMLTASVFIGLARVLRAPGAFAKF